MKSNKVHVLFIMAVMLMACILLPESVYAEKIPTISAPERDSIHQVGRPIEISANCQYEPIGVLKSNYIYFRVTRDGETVHYSSEPYVIGFIPIRKSFTPDVVGRYRIEVQWHATYSLGNYVPLEEKDFTAQSSVEIVVKPSGSSGGIGGSGTPNDPYEIVDYGDLKTFGQIVGGKHTSIPKNTEACAVLKADIYASGDDWTPIGGSGSDSYGGTFDGKGYSISGLKVNGTDVPEYAALFVLVNENGAVCDLGMINTDSIAGDGAAGVAVYNEGTITNCFNTGSVRATRYYSGGVVAWNSGTVDSCHNEGSVECTRYSGGVVGVNVGGTVTNCSNEGQTKGKSCVGGVVGWNTGIVSDCNNTGDVSGENGWMSGVAGHNQGTVANCYNTGSVFAENSSSSGVAGLNEGSVSNCYNKGSISTENGISSGVIAQNLVSVSNCYNIGDITSKNTSEYENNAVSAGVVGTNGKVGTNNSPENGGTVENCYSSGTITIQNSNYIAGVVAATFGGKIRNAYFDKEKSPMTEAIAQNNAAAVTNVKALTTSEMTGLDCTAYDPWDNFYAIWKLAEGYPFLEPHDHDLNYESRVEGSCVSVGHVEGYTCTVCNKHFGEETAVNLITDSDWLITDADHSYGEWERLDDDRHRRICAHNETHMEISGHTWDAGRITQHATVDEPGIRTFTCTVCRDEKTQTIPKLDPETHTTPTTTKPTLPKPTTKPVKTPTGKVTILNTIANSARKTNDVIWDKSKVKNATNYEINWRARGSGKWASRTVGNTVRGTTTGLTIKGLYEIRVRPVSKPAGAKTAKYGAWSNTVYRYFHTTEKIRLKSASRGGFTMSWKDNPQATGYQVMFTTNKNGSGAARNINTVGKGKTSFTRKGLKSGQAYYVQVREIRKIGSTNYIGNISCPVAVKVK